MEKKQFQTETKQLLNIMINSIYTHKEIFLRELISNASDALDKIKFESLQDVSILKEQEDLEIFIDIDKKKKLITIEDTGIGMSYDDVVENLGTIARSGTKNFIEKLKNADEKKKMEMIGQFGVGFYSVFMIADNVVIETKKYNQDKGVKWISKGDGEYEIEEFEKEKRGTKIIITVKKDLDEKDYNFLDKNVIENLVKKYSDYIRYPIKMEVEEEIEIDSDEDNKEKKTKKQIVIKVLNSMQPIWTKKSSDVKNEEYNDFYKEKFHDWSDPLESIHFKAEGSTVEFTALLFIPSKAPFDYYTKEFKKGVKLYSKGVFIMDRYEDLIPDYFSFIKGLIDSPDFSLNISREILQHSRQIEVIRKNIEKKILNSLKDKINKDREKYVEFWNEFGKGIKAGLYENISDKDKVVDIMLFNSSKSDTKMTTLQEYIDRMLENQEAKIYYAVGENIQDIKKLPQIEAILDKDFEVLFLTDPVDEFLIKILHDYKGKSFISVSEEEISSENKKEIEDKEKENKELIDVIKDYLKDKVSDVRFSTRLKTSPVCIVSSSKGPSVNMEKILKGLDQIPFKADKILEINPNHQVFTTIQTMYDKNKDDNLIKDYSYILYNQALILEGMKIEEPDKFSESISNLMININK